MSQPSEVIVGRDPGDETEKERIWGGSAVGPMIPSHHLKMRDGDQQLPVVNEHRDIQSQVIEDIEARRLVGIERYGTALQPYNGRSAIRDAYEEALDLATYLKQMLVEEELDNLVNSA